MSISSSTAGLDEPSFDRRQMVLGGILAASGSAVLYPRLQKSPQPPTREAFGEATPDKLGHFRRIGNDGLILPKSDLSDQIYTNLGLGVYSNNIGSKVMLLVAYDQTEERGQLELHRPEACYGSAGFDVERPKLLTIIGPNNIAVSATFWTAVRADRVEQVLFWTRVARTFPTNAWQQNLAIIRGNLVAKGVSDAALVRLSIASTDRSGSFDLLKSFAHNLAHNLSPAGSRIVFGPDAV